MHVPLYDVAIISESDEKKLAKNMMSLVLLLKQPVMPISGTKHLQQNQRVTLKKNVPISFVESFAYFVTVV